MRKQNIHNHSEIINAFGGTCAVSAMFNITTGAVSQWRTNGIPDARMMYLKLIRPEVFVDNKQNESPV